VVPDKFDGSIPWNDYCTHFNICADINGWNDNQKAKFLAVSLRGSAQMLLGDLSPTYLEDYGRLVYELQARFGQDGQAELFRTQLKDRIKRHDESFPEMGQDMKRLVGRAYPGATGALQDQLARDHFCDALGDSAMYLFVYQSHATSLNKAIQAAIEFQAFKQAESHRNRHVMSGMQEQIRRPVRATLINEQHDVRNHPCMTRDEVYSVVTDVIRQEMASHGGQRGNGRNVAMYSSVGAAGHAPKPSDKVCWSCGLSGHFKRECPNDPSSSRSPEQVKRSGNGQ
jgi:hypothetical protein